MTELYKLTPTVTAVPEQQFGRVAPSAPIPEIDMEPEGSFLNAMASETLSYRLGRRVSQYFTQNNSAQEGYDPFQQWKDLDLGDEYLDDVMATDNEDQLINLLGRIKQDTAAREKISSYGLAGEAANFVFSVATDPTTYMGFGAGMMLKSGMGATKAFAASGAAAGATYSALEEVASPERNTLESGLVTTVASTVLGGALGRAVDSFSSLQAKKVIEKDFSTMATDAMNSASTLPQRQAALSAGAMAVEDLSGVSNAVGGNIVSRSLAKSTRLLSPRLWGQTAELKETQDFMSRFFGVSARTEANIEQGVRAPISFGDETQKLRDQAVGKVAQSFDRKELVQKFGSSGTEDDFTAVFQAHFQPDADIEKLTPLQRHIYDFEKQYYDDYAKMLTDESVPYFNERDQYGRPLVFSQEKATERVGELSSTIEARMLREKAEAEARIDFLQKDLDAERLAVKSNPDQRIVQMAESRIARIEDQIEDLALVARATDDEISEEAGIAAHEIAGGIFYDQLSLSPKQVANKSRFFKERHIDPLEFSDFLEHNPVVLARKYADSVSPHIGFKRAFPEYQSPQKMIEDYKTKASENLGSAKDRDKAQAEIGHAIERMERLWNTETGVELSQKTKDLGAFAPYVAAVNDLMYMTQMGGQLLASLVEPIGIGIHHGLTGGLKLGKTVARLATDADFRKLSTKEAQYGGVAIEIANNKILHDMMGYQVADREMNNVISRASRKGALLMGRANMSIYWDQLMRTSLYLSQSGIMKESLNKFSTLSKEQIGDLAFLGIDKTNVGKITEQLKKYGKDDNGLFVANAENWDDASARELWINALRKDLRRTSVQVDSGDVPFLFRTPLGKLFTKYKSWGVAATSKILIQSSQYPTKSIGGIAALVSAGTLVDVLLNKSQGKDVSTDPDELIWAGINRSGVLGVLPEAGGSFLLNRIAGVQSGGGRLYEYQDAPGLIAGATGSFLQDAATVVGATLPKYDSDSGEYNYGFYGKNGKIRQGVVNSTIDMMPLPFIKPWAKEYSKELIE